MTTKNIAELIGLIRDAHDVSEDEIAYIIRALTDETMSDAQVGAFAMAVVCRGLSDETAVALTAAMRDSGIKLSWNVDGQIVDKHSTGGVGDCVSLALAPILASAGYYVPMISGRGLGHTGGTLDKLEAIEGFSTRIPIDDMQAQLREIGVVMAGQTADLVPADKRLYAIRDVTGTVPSQELIVASILSKKLAAGLERLVLDVKVGAGAFMKDIEEARALAQRLVQTANALGLKTSAKLTAMDMPLANSAGNAMEVREIIALLEGQMDTPLYEITRALCVTLGMSAEQVDEAIASRRALERFEQMCAAQGAQSDISKIKKSLPTAPIVRDVLAQDDAEFHGFDAYKIGMAVIDLGGGRKRQTDRIDLSVGISDMARPSSVKKGDLLAKIYAKCEEDADRAESQIMNAIRPAASILPLHIEDIT